MDKKTKTIVIVVLAVVVVGGLYYGVNRWRQQRLANQILKQVYGVNTGLLGKLTGGGITKEIAQEMAKQAAQDEAQQKMDEAQEAAKTPEDKYNEAKEATIYDANSKAAVNAAKDILEKVFGKAKLTSVYTDVYDSAGSSSTMLEFKIARLIIGDDLSALNKELTKKHFSITHSVISDKTALVVASQDENTTYSFDFEIGGQTVGVNIIKSNQ